MTIALYLYCPLDVNTRASEYTVPTIDSDAHGLANKLRNPEEQAEGDNNNNHGGYGHQPPEYKLIQRFHKDNWITVLAWSHGVSNDGSSSNFQDLSLTKYRDKYSPLIKFMVMKCEMIPHAILRCVGMPKDGKVNITEMEMYHVNFTSISSGGSGGEDRLTENVTMDCKKSRETITEINIETGEVISQNHSSWDIVNKNGIRSFLNAEAAKESASDAANTTTSTTTSTPDAETKAAFPEKGRTLLVTSDYTTKRFKTITLLAPTKAALVTAVATKLNIDAAKVKTIYEVRGEFLVEVENDKLVDELVANSCLFAELN